MFEDVEQRDFNPNVSLELGYLMGRGEIKRCIGVDFGLSF